MKKHLTKIISILAISPLIVSATTVTDFKPLGGFIDDFKNNVLTSLSALFLTAAVVAFFYGVVIYIYGIRNGVPDDKGKGRDFMLWGLIALFVMFSVWGIVTFAQKTLDIQGQTTIQIPSIRFQDTGGAPTGGAPGGATTGDVAGQASPYVGAIQSFFGGATSGTNSSNSCPTGWVRNVSGSGCVTNTSASQTTTSGGQTGMTATEAYMVCRNNGNTDAECQPGYQQLSGGTGNIANSYECSTNSQCQSGNCVLSATTGVSRCQP